MSNANLMLHTGGREVEREELKQIILPPATRTWKPIGHETVLNTALDSLNESGYRVRKMKLGLANSGSRFFGTLDLESILVPGVALAVGLRNSIDKTFPMGFCAGSRVFVCDNLAFSADLMVRRKHTINGQRRFSDDIVVSVSKLKDFVHNETKRIEILQHKMLSDVEAESFMLRSCVQKGIVAQKDLPAIFREYHEPRHEDFRPRTAWSLLNAFTEIMRDMQASNPNELAKRTMRLQAMLTQDDILRAAASDAVPVLAV